MKQETDHTYTLRLLVRNQPGVLVRCAQIYGRRGHNIEALHVVPHAHHDTSIMTITAFGRQETIAQIKLQLAKLYDVLTVNEGDAK